jgi:hypothetical protein
MKAVFITEHVVIFGFGGQGMEKNNHEEADTHIVLHVMHSLQRGSIMNVRTVDSDVVGNYNQFVDVVGNYNQFVDINPAAEVWVRYETGNHIREICINTIFTKHSYFPTLSSLFWFLWLRNGVFIQGSVKEEFTKEVLRR